MEAGGARREKYMFQKVDTKTERRAEVGEREKGSSFASHRRPVTHTDTRFPETCRSLPYGDKWAAAS